MSEAALIAVLALLISVVAVLVPHIVRRLNRRRRRLPMTRPIDAVLKIGLVEAILDVP